MHIYIRKTNNDTCCHYNIIICLCFMNMLIGPTSNLYGNFFKVNRFIDEYIKALGPTTQPTLSEFNILVYM